MDFNPAMGMATGRCLGLCALVRWQPAAAALERLSTGLGGGTGVLAAAGFDRRSGAGALAVVAGAWTPAVALAGLAPYLLLLLRNTAWPGMAWLAVAMLVGSGLLPLARWNGIGGAEVTGSSVRAAGWRRCWFG